MKLFLVYSYCLDCFGRSNLDYLLLSLLYDTHYKHPNDAKNANHLSFENNVGGHVSDDVSTLITWSKYDAINGACAITIIVVITIIATSNEVIAIVTGKLIEKYNQSSISKDNIDPKTIK